MTMKLNYKRTFLVGMAFLSISAFWQMYDSSNGCSNYQLYSDWCGIL